MTKSIAFVLLALSCAVEQRPRNVDFGSYDFASTDLAEAKPVACKTMATPAVGDVVLAPAFQPHYTAYHLGAIPGVPNNLGGMIIKSGSPNTLIVGGESERQTGALYEIEVLRDSCGHIYAFSGTAKQVAATPFVDANLLYGMADVLLYAEWPQYKISQMLPGATGPSRTIDLKPLGIITGMDRGPGGIGFVPPGLAAHGELRFVTWPEGNWYQANTTLGTDGLYAIGSIIPTAQLPNNPGGFAYVPKGSPGFPIQSVIVAEWKMNMDDRVAVYEVNAAGDPIPATRQEFFSRFPRPWGAYFEPQTGDYFFLTWGTGMDRVYTVQGFLPPPPVF